MPPVERPEASAGSPAHVAPPRVAPSQFRAAQAESRDSFEDRLGSQIFNRVGIVAVLIAMAMFFKLAVDRRWIVPSPTGRVIAGLAIGAVIVLWSERFRRKGFEAFSYSLKALGSGVLYLSLWSAFQLFHLLPAEAALGLMVLVTAWNAWMAWAQDSELLAAYALAGGFGTPLLLSSSGNHEIFLFSYLLAIDIATVLLVRVKPWPRLLLGAFPLTVAFFIGWYSEFFAARDLALTAVFLMLFDSTFSSVPIGRAKRDAASSQSGLITLIEDILLPLGTSAFLSLGLYSILQDSGHHALPPWLMLALAAVYLAFMRLPQSRVASAMHLSLAVVYLTIAVPLKASGHWITVSWLVEGLALLWVATRLAPGKESPAAAESYASTTLRWLASAALALGFSGVVVHALGWDFNGGATFFNANTATSLTGVAVLAGAAWLALRAAGDAGKEADAWPGIAVAAFLGIDTIALLLTSRELVGASIISVRRGPFQSADFLAALIGLAIFAGVVAVSLQLSRSNVEAGFWSRLAGVSAIGFNLVAILTGVREISAIWSFSGPSANPDAMLQQALAISGFLMVYGAALLAAGFWERSAFLRWQALLLLIFSIFKTFLYDMRNLSQGYRVVSFFALGALLMAISFAYQRDWLNLRASAPTDAASGRAGAAQ